MTRFYPWSWQVCYEKKGASWVCNLDGTLPKTWSLTCSLTSFIERRWCFKAIFCFALEQVKGLPHLYVKVVHVPGILDPNTCLHDPSWQCPRGHIIIQSKWRRNLSSSAVRTRHFVTDFITLILMAVASHDNKNDHDWPKWFRATLMTWAMTWCYARESL